MGAVVYRGTGWAMSQTLFQLLNSGAFAGDGLVATPSCALDGGAADFGRAPVATSYFCHSTATKQTRSIDRHVRRNRKACHIPLSARGIATDAEYLAAAGDCRVCD